MIKKERIYNGMIKVGDFPIGKDERNAILDVLNNGRISEWRKVREFERQWSDFIGTKYCVATSSGTGALICALTALKYYKRLKRGVKVITSPLTYIVDSSAVSNVGFEPVYVDVDPETFCINPETIEEYLRRCPDIKRHAAILAIDLMGFPVEIDKINRIAKKFGISVIEDAAHAHDTVYKGNKCGSKAMMGIFSFYIAHNIQAGEMGAVVTNNTILNALIRRIKAQGRACNCLLCTRITGHCPKSNAYAGGGDLDPRFLHDLIGYNFKTMEFQAALALGQIKKIKWIKERRLRNVRRLNEGLAVFKDILQLPRYSEDISYLAYPIVIRRPDLISRRKLRMQLEIKRGIETRPLFGCIPLHQPAYSHLKKKYRGKLPYAEFAGENGFYIGCHQYIDDKDIDYISDSFRAILKSGDLK